jgi:S-adenosylmethionine:tRNA ribosyltransferase-isomerase
MSTRLSDFDYHLPESLIAQEPVSPRDASRLLVVSRADGSLSHRTFAELPELLAPSDLLVVNDTRVIPARLLGTRQTGGRVELLLVEPVADAAGPGGCWRAMGQASKPLRPGTALRFGELAATIEEAEGEGFFRVRFEQGGAALQAALEREARLPLPPYIRRAPGTADLERYQTVMARWPGSVAAPTAGLHFTPGLFERLAARGVERTAVTLHVGPGTFLPVRTDDVSGHRMHEERYLVPPDASAAFAACRARGGRVVAVGTTSVRTLESAFEGAALRPGDGRTQLFILPGHPFRTVDALITNFHLPRSTLLMLVCAFGGRERILGAYSEAVRLGYRFYSYGDAMLIL